MSDNTDEALSTEGRQILIDLKYHIEQVSFYTEDTALGLQLNEWKQVLDRYIAEMPEERED